MRPEVRERLYRAEDEVLAWELAYCCGRRAEAIGHAQALRALAQRLEEYAGELPKTTAPRRGSAPAASVGTGAAAPEGTPKCAEAHTADVRQFGVVPGGRGAFSEKGERC